MNPGSNHDTENAAIPFRNFKRLGVGVTHLGLLQGFSGKPLSQRLRTKLGDFVSARVDLAGKHQGVQPTQRWQGLEEFVDVFIREGVLASGHPCGIVLLPLLQVPGLVLALLDGKILRFVEFHRFLRNNGKNNVTKEIINSFNVIK